MRPSLTEGAAQDAPLCAGRRRALLALNSGRFTTMGDSGREAEGVASALSAGEGEAEGVGSSEEDTTGLWRRRAVLLTSSGELLKLVRRRWERVLGEGVATERREVRGGNCHRHRAAFCSGVRR